MPIIDMSPQMQAIAMNGGRKSKYPWLSLEVGKCFTVPESEVKYASLVTLAYRTGKQHNRLFRVVHHKEQQLYEVARLEVSVGT